MQNIAERTTDVILPGLQRFHIWRWLAISSQMVMEVSYIVPWYRSLTPGTFAVGEARVLLVFLALMLFNFGVAWFAQAISFKIIVRRVLFGLSLVICIFMGYRYLLYYQQDLTAGELFDQPFKAVAEVITLIPDEILVALFVMLAGLRGIVIARQQVSPSSMVRRFQIGIVFFILFVFVNTLVTGESPGFVFPLFLFTGLIAMSSARLAVLERLRGGRLVAFDRRWFLGIMISCSLAALLALGTGRLFTSSAAVSISEFFNSLLLILFGLILLLLAPVLFLLLFTFLRINRMLAETNAFPELVENLQTIISSASGLAEQMLTWIDQYLPPLETIRIAFLWGTVVFVLVIGLVLVGVAVTKRGRANAAQDHMEALENTLFSWLKAALLNSMRAVNQVLQNQLQAREGKRARQRIRRIYQEILALSQTLGLRLSPDQTPLEIMPLLAELFHPLGEDVYTITEAYQRVRYGELPEKGEDLLAIEAARERILVLGKTARSKTK
jgi:hypothetical protein